MRSGRLLAEDSPHNLLVNHNLISLEDVFLKLCMKENTDQNDQLQIASNSSSASVSSEETTMTSPSSVTQQDRLTIMTQSSSDTDDQQQPTNETFANNESEIITCISTVSNVIKFLDHILNWNNLITKF